MMQVLHATCFTIIAVFAFSARLQAQAFVFAKPSTNVNPMACCKPPSSLKLIARRPFQLEKTMRSSNSQKMIKPSLSLFPLITSSSTALNAIPSSPVSVVPWLILRGGGGEISELATGAYEWCMDLNSPSALVAGAVIATIYENIGSGALDIDAKKDTQLIQFGKRVTRLLLLSAFAFEVLSIFVTTVTGTMLLSHTEASLDALNPTKMVSKSTTPLHFLNDNFEFEYLTARITFLQGLLNWLGAIALGHILPSGESTDSRVMNQFIGLGLMLLMVVMVAFYNDHMNFYRNYACMLSRWMHVGWAKFIWTWPPRPSIVFSLPILAKTMQLGYLAFTRGNHANGRQAENEGSDN